MSRYSATSPAPASSPADPRTNAVSSVSRDDLDDLQATQSAWAERRTDALEGLRGPFANVAQALMRTARGEAENLATESCARAASRARAEARSSNAASIRQIAAPPARLQHAAQAPAPRHSMSAHDPAPQRAWGVACVPHAEAPAPGQAKLGRHCDVSGSVARVSILTACGSTSLPRCRRTSARLSSPGIDRGQRNPGAEVAGRGEGRDHVQEGLARPA